MGSSSRERPRWRHSDGRPYDDLDLGFTRFEDELDGEGAPMRGSALRRLFSALLRRARFRHRIGTDTRRFRE